MKVESQGLPRWWLINGQGLLKKYLWNTTILLIFNLGYISIISLCIYPFIHSHWSGQCHIMYVLAWSSLNSRAARCCKWNIILQELSESQKYADRGNYWQDFVTDIIINTSCFSNDHHGLLLMKLKVFKCFVGLQYFRNIPTFIYSGCKDTTKSQYFALE